MCKLSHLYKFDMWKKIIKKNRETSVLDIVEHRNLIFDSYRFLVFNIKVFRLWWNDMHVNNFCGGIDNLQGLYMFLIHLKASKMYDCRFCQDTRILRNFGVNF